MEIIRIICSKNNILIFDKNIVQNEPPTYVKQKT